MLTNRNFDKSIENKMVKQFPNEAPFFHELLVDRSGIIYVVTHTLDNESRRYIDIFNSDGSYQYRGTIQLETGSKIISNLAIASKQLGAFVEDEAGETALRCYKIFKPAPK